MHFRDARPADIAAMVDALDDRNAIPVVPRVRAALPTLLPKLMASPADSVTVFEDASLPPEGLFSWSATALVRPQVIEAYLDAPEPGLFRKVLEQMLDDARPLLTLDELRRANSGTGIDAVRASLPMARMRWDHPMLDQLRRLAPLAFVHAVGGFRLRAVYHEVFVDEIARYMEQGGYRLVFDFSDRAGTGFIRPTRGPGCCT